MKTKIEFYIDGKQIDVREWVMVPTEGLVVELVDSSDDSSRIVVVMRVTAIGDEDGFKYALICMDFDEHERLRKQAMEGQGRTS